MIGYAMCGSYCTHRRSLEALRELVRRGEDVIPIVSENVYSTDTRFGRADELMVELENICGRTAVHTIVEAELFGPSVALEAMIIAPCTGNTLAKLAAGITDTAVCMAAKAHLRSDRRLLIALATNDALSANLRNIGIMRNRKNVYFVPLERDDPRGKPHSLVADFSMLEDSLEAMRRGVQVF